MAVKDDPVGPGCIEGIRSCLSVAGFLAGSRSGRGRHESRYRAAELALVTLASNWSGRPEFEIALTVFGKSQSKWG